MNKHALVTLWMLCQMIGVPAAGLVQDVNSVPEATAEEIELAFSDIPNLGIAYVDTTPAIRKDGLSVGALGVNGGDKDIMVALAQEITEGAYGNIDSLLIAQKDQLLFESYYRRGRVDLPHMQASATKSYSSLAIGRAIQLGHLTIDDLDKPLIGFFDNLDPTKFVAGAELITLHQAMTMQSGLRIELDRIEELEKNPEQIRGALQIQHYLEISKSISPESQVFYYHFNDLQLVMQVLEAVVPGSAEDFIQTELLDKLGIDNYFWREDFNGLPAGYSGARMTPRDMVKWGSLVLNKGRWGAEQLIPEEFIAKATSDLVHFGDLDVYSAGPNVTSPSYGYYWWQADMKVGDKSYFTTSAQGGGGQYIFVIDELDLIIVSTAHDDEDKTMQIAAEKIIPAFVN